MRYKIGQKVEFDWDNYGYYYNTDLEYEGTERLTGKIESYDEEKKSYSIRVGDILYPVVKEYKIVDKAAEFKHNLNDAKIKIANAALKMRNARYKECSEKYDKYYEELFDLMSEYDDIEDKYIMLGGERKTY